MLVLSVYSSLQTLFKKKKKLISLIPISSQTSFQQWYARRMCSLLLFCTFVAARDKQQQTPYLITTGKRRRKSRQLALKTKYNLQCAHVERKFKTKNRFPVDIFQL